MARLRRRPSRRPPRLNRGAARQPPRLMGGIAHPRAARRDRGRRRRVPARPGDAMTRAPAVTIPMAEPRWGGGLLRADLADVIGVRETDPVFEVSVLACYARRQVDFCWATWWPRRGRTD